MNDLNLNKLQFQLKKLEGLKEIELAWTSINYKLNKHQLREIMIEKVLDGEFDKFVETEIINEPGLGPGNIHYSMICKLGD